MLLADQDRREGEAHGPAIGLKAPVAARAEQRRRVDAGRIEARAILGIRQEVIDDLGRVGVDPVDAGSGENPDDLEVVVSDRGRVAEVVAGGPGVGRPLIGEGVVRIERGQVRPDRLRRRPVLDPHPELERDVDREVFPDQPDAGDWPFAQPEDDVGGIGIAVARRRAAAEAALAADALARAARDSLEIGEPQEVRRDLVPPPDDRNRQGRRRGLDLQRREVGLAVVVAAEEAHRSAPIAREFRGSQPRRKLRRPVDHVLEHATRGREGVHDGQGLRLRHDPPMRVAAADPEQDHVARRPGRSTIRARASRKPR